MTIAPCSWASRGDLDRVGRLHEPGLREVRRMDAQHDRGPARRRAAPRSRRRASGSSSRPRSAGRRSAGRSPGSGRRRRSRPARRARPRPRACPASPTASASAAALLTVTSASSAPVSAMRCVLRGAEPRPAPAGLAVELEERVRRRPRASPPRSPTRRPRRAPEVRVQDHAGRVEDRGQAAPRSDPRRRPGGCATSTSASASTSAGASPARQPRPLVGDHVAGDGSDRRRRRVLGRAAAGRRPSSRSTLGGRGDRSTCGPPWRERVGVEPTAPRRAPRHWF